MTSLCLLTPSSESSLGEFARLWYLPSPFGTAEERIVAFVCGARFTEETLPVFLINCAREMCDLVVFVRCSVGHPDNILSSSWYVNESYNYDTLIRLATPHLQEREAIQLACQPNVEENTAIRARMRSVDDPVEFFTLKTRSNELDRKIWNDISRTRSLPRLPMKVFLFDCMYNVEDLGYSASVPTFIDELNLVMMNHASIDRAVCHRYSYLPINGQTVISLFTEPDVLVNDEMIITMFGGLIQLFSNHRQGNAHIELVIHESSTIVAFHETEFITPDHLDRLMRSLPEHVQTVQFHHCLFHEMVKCVCPPHLRVVEFNFCSLKHENLDSMFISTQGGESSLTNLRFTHCDLRTVMHALNLLLPHPCIVEFYASKINEALKTEIESQLSVNIDERTELHLLAMYRQICSERADDPTPYATMTQEELAHIFANGPQFST